VSGDGCDHVTSGDGGDLQQWFTATFTPDQAATIDRVVRACERDVWSFISGPPPNASIGVKVIAEDGDVSVSVIPPAGEPVTLKPGEEEYRLSLSALCCEYEVAITGEPFAGGSYRLMVCRSITSACTFSDQPTPPLPAPTPTPAPEGIGAIAVDCDIARAGVQDVCSHRIDSEFIVQLHVTRPPAGGYQGFRIKLEWSNVMGVNYLPAAGARAEVLWPGCTVADRTTDGGTEVGDHWLAFSCLTLPPPSLGSDDAGPVLQFRFRAGGEHKASFIRLTPAPMVGDPALGSYFLDATGGIVTPALSNAIVMQVGP
jgi:hypothetical protein